MHCSIVIISFVWSWIEASASVGVVRPISDGSPAQSNVVNANHADPSVPFTAVPISKSQPTYTCPDGFTLDGIKCYRYANVQPHLSCTSGMMQGNTCVTHSPATTTCPSGFSPTSDNQCSRTTMETLVPLCPEGFSLESGECVKYVASPPVSSCTSGALRDGYCVTSITEPVQITCPPPAALVDGTCWAPDCSSDPNSYSRRVLQPCPKQDPVAGLSHGDKGNKALGSKSHSKEKQLGLFGKQPLIQSGGLIGLVAPPQTTTPCSQTQIFQPTNVMRSCSGKVAVAPIRSCSAGSQLVGDCCLRESRTPPLIGCANPQNPSGNCFNRMTVPFHLGCQNGSAVPRPFSSIGSSRSLFMRKDDGEKKKGPFTGIAQLPQLVPMNVGANKHQPTGCSIGACSQSLSVAPAPCPPNGPCDSGSPYYGSQPQRYNAGSQPIQAEQPLSVAPAPCPPNGACDSGSPYYSSQPQRYNAGSQPGHSSEAAMCTDVVPAKRTCPPGATLSSNDCISLSEPIYSCPDNLTQNGNACSGKDIAEPIEVFSETFSYTCVGLGCSDNAFPPPVPSVPNPSFIPHQPDGQYAYNPSFLHQPTNGHPYSPNY